MTRNTELTVSKARTIFAKLTKVAEDMLDVAAAPAPEPSQEEAEAGTAGPQEVVDALGVIVDELEQVQEAIPAEPTNEEVEVEAEQVDVAEPAVEEEPKIAKLQRDLKVAQGELTKIALERMAETYAEQFDEPRVQQAKYDEVISSKEGVSYWTAQIKAIEQYKETTGATSYKPAQTTTSWLKPRSKVAKLGSEMLRL